MEQVFAGSLRRRLGRYDFCPTIFCGYGTAAEHLSAGEWICTGRGTWLTNQAVLSELGKPYNLILCYQSCRRDLGNK